MQITFLGTGTSQGIPIIACDCRVCKSDNPKDNRLRSSILIETKNQTIIIDTGPDFRQQMLRKKVKKLDAIIFTHAHKDHTGGMDDIRSFNYIQGKPMDVYAEKNVQESLKREYAYVFAEEKYPGIPEVALHTIQNQPFNIENTNIIPIRLLHHQLPILGFRIGNFAYLIDTNHIPEEEKKKLQNLDVLVITGLRKETHISHFSLPEAIEVIKEIKPRMAYITHIGHQLGMHDEVEMELPEYIRLSYDGLTLHFNE